MESFIYALTMGNSDILYIGQTTDPHTRYMSHKSNTMYVKNKLYTSMRMLIKSKSLTIEDMKLTILDSADTSSIDELEQDWISGYDNLLNTMHNKRARVQPIDMKRLNNKVLYMRRKGQLIKHYY